MDRWERKMARMQEKMERVRAMMERFGGRGDWFGPPSSGNRAFDDYRAETLKRLEDEQREFKDFLERLRFAKDRAEFDQFMAARRERPSEPGSANRRSKSRRTPEIRRAPVPRKARRAGRPVLLRAALRFRDDDVRTAVATKIEQRCAAFILYLKSRYYFMRARVFWRLNA